MTTLAGSGVHSVAGYGTDWLYLAVPLLGALTVAALLVRRGTAPRNAQRGTRTLLRFADGASQVTGLPPYAAAGVLTCLQFLLVAALGFYWDVAWHVDYGRDQLLFTPAHTAIIVGLQGLLVTAAVVTLVATWTRADVAVRVRGLRMPRAAVVLFALGIGAVGAFPLDELWHRAYGVDVTMWGPTHLGMIGGASFAPLALLVLVREAGPVRLTRYGRRLMVILSGAMLLGFSTFQLEFDLGVPQWQHLYHPVLIALASGFALVAARHLIGRGGALLAAAEFTIQRIVTAFVVAGALHHTMPHWALYFGSALAIEVAAALTRRRAPLLQALSYGAAVSIGLAAEWAWTQVWGRHPWGRALLPGIGVAVVAAFAAALLGTAAGRRLRGTSAGLPAWLLAAAGVVAVGTLVVPFPRHGTTETATLRTSPAGPGYVDVDVTIDDALAKDADWFEVFAWQGGSFHRAALRHTGPDEWRTVKPVPVGGSWKTMARLAKDDVLVAIPVAMPADPQIHAPAIPLVAERTAPLVRDTVYLMREKHHGATTPALIAYAVLGAFAAMWVTAFVKAFRSPRLNRPDPLAGKRVVVTGALGGIAAATIPALREAGANVVGVDLVAAPDVVAGDVTSPESMRAAMAAAAERLGGIDLLVNLAGIGRAQDTGDFPDAEAHRVLDVNFWGTWHATSAALPWLLDARGHVVVTASGLASVTVPWAPAYAASKRAVSAYADTLRAEYHDRLSVTVVNPGYVRTPIHEVAAASGASLEGLVPADEMPTVVAAFVRACTARPRALATSRRTALGMWLASRRPALMDRLVQTAIRRQGRPDPTFVRYRSTRGNTNQKNAVTTVTNDVVTTAATPPYTNVDTR